MSPLVFHRESPFPVSVSLGNKVLLSRLQAFPAVPNRRVQQTTTNDPPESIVSGHRKRSSRLATIVRRLPARFRRRFDRDPLAIHQHSTRPATTRLDLARLGSARLRSVRVELRSTDGAAYRQAVVSIHTLLLESARSTLTNTVSPPRPILDPPMHARTHARTHTHTAFGTHTDSRALDQPSDQPSNHPTSQPAIRPASRPNIYA